MTIPTASPAAARRWSPAASATIPARPTSSTAQRFGSLTVVGTGLPGTIAQTAGTVETAGSVPNGANFSATAKPNDYDVVNEAYHARFPRYDLVFNHEKRLGFYSSVQWQPGRQDPVHLGRPSLPTSTSSATSSSWKLPVPFDQRHIQPAGACGLSRACWRRPWAPTASMSSLTPGERGDQQPRDPVGHGCWPPVGTPACPLCDTRFQQMTLDGSHEFSDSFKVCMACSASRSPTSAIRSIPRLTMDYNRTAATSNTGTIAGQPGRSGRRRGHGSQPFHLQLRGREQICAVHHLRQCRCDSRLTAGSCRRTRLPPTTTIIPTARSPSTPTIRSTKLSVFRVAPTIRTSATAPSRWPAAMALPLRCPAISPDMEAHSALGRYLRAGVAVRHWRVAQARPPPGWCPTSTRRLRNTIF